MSERQLVEAFQGINLIARSSMEENLDALAGSFRALRSILDEVALRFETSVTSAEIFHCFTHTDILGKAGERCSDCGLALQPRRIPYSFIHARPEQPTVKLSLADQASAKEGQEVRLNLQLQTIDGRPLDEADLWPMHAQKVQFMMVSDGGADFQHFTAARAEKSGCYSASFSPAFAGGYRIHAGITPAATGLPEYPFVSLKVEGNRTAPNTIRSLSMAAESEGLRFSLSVAGNAGNQLHAGMTQALRLQVTDLAGQPVTRLEPVHQAFAHLYGVFTDSGTLLQLHPVGGDILREDVRGGPGFVFKIFSPEPGPLRLFTQVCMGGKNMLVPLTAVVRP